MSEDKDTSFKKLGDVVDTDAIDSFINAEVTSYRNGLAKKEEELLGEEDPNKDYQFITRQERIQKLRRYSLDNDVVQSELDDRQSDRDMRESYANRVYFYLCAYSLFMVGILIWYGKTIFETGKVLFPESVLSTLVGSTAVAAIGLVYAVVNGLFNGKSK